MIVVEFDPGTGYEDWSAYVDPFPSLSVENLATGQSGSASVPLLDPPSAPQPDWGLRITDDSVEIFEGLVDGVAESDLVDPGGPQVVTVTGVDFTRLLDYDVVPKRYRSVSETAGERIKWLVDTYGTHGVTADEPECQDILAMPGGADGRPEQEFGPSSLRRAIEKVTKISGGRLYVDFDKKLHHFLDEAAAAPFNLSDEPDDLATFAYFDFRLETNDTDRVDQVVVYGARQEDGTLRTVTRTVASPPATPRIAPLVDETLTTQAEAEAAGDAYLLAHASRRSGNLKTLEPGLRAGQTVQITHTGKGLSAESFRIHRVTLKPDGPATAVYEVAFGDEPPSLAGIISGPSGIGGVARGAADTASDTARRIADLQAGGANLVANSSFENASTTGWSIGSNWTFNQAAADAFDGANEARLTLAAATGGDLLAPIIAVDRLYDYWVSAWVLMRARTAGSVTVELREYSDAGATALVETTTIAEFDAAGTDWERVSRRFGPNDQIGRTAFHADTVTIRLAVTSTATATLTFAIDAAQIERGSILTAYAPRPQELADGAITATQIADDAITTPKIAANAVVAGKIAADTISATEIQAGAVTTDKLAAGQITLYGPDGQTILTPTRFGDTWWRMIHGWIANGDFRAPPDSLATNIDNSTNPLPDWSLAKASGTAINGQVVTDAGNGSGHALRFIMGSGASGDSTYVEQIVPVMATQNRAFSFSPYAHVEWIARSGSNVAEVWVELQFLTEDGSTTGSAYLQAVADFAPGSAHELGLQSGNTAPPADAYAARVRYGLRRRSGASTSATATVQINETLMLAAQPRVHVAEVTAPATYSRGSIQQQNGAIAILPHGLSGGTYPPSLVVAGYDATHSQKGRVTVFNAALSFDGVSPTAFPANPSDGWLYYHPTYREWCVFDGTRWRGEVRDLPIGAFRDLPLNATTTAWYVAIPGGGAHNVYAISVAFSFFINSGGSALSGSHKWDLELTRQGSGTSLATYSINSGSSAAWRTSGAVSIGALLGTTDFLLQVRATKTGTPGDLHMAPMVRLVPVYT